MNYTPNLAARSLITRRTGTVGVVVSDITNPFYPELLDILHNELALAGYRTVLFNERTDASVEQHVADLVNGAAVDGLVYVSATLGTPLPGRRCARGPGRPREPLHRLGAGGHGRLGQPRGGRLVAEAMVELGHRRIALIAGPENTTTSRDRERGFREQLQASRRPVRREPAPRRSVQPPQRLPVVPRPPRRGAARRPPCSPRTT